MEREEILDSKWLEVYQRVSRARWAGLEPDSEDLAFLTANGFAEDMIVESESVNMFGDDVLITNEEKEKMKIADPSDKMAKSYTNEQILLISTPIEQLGLSVRSENGLKNHGINTLGQLIDLKEEDLFHIRNLGRKSVDEILALIERVNLEDLFAYPDEPPEIDVSNGEEHSKNRTYFYNGVLYDDIPIEKLHLSSRTYNCLKRAKLNFVSQIQDIDEDSLLNIKNFGQHSLIELRTVMESLDPEPYVNVEKASEANHYMEFYSGIINTFSEAGLNLSTEQFETVTTLCQAHAKDDIGDDIGDYISAFILPELLETPAMRGLAEKLILKSFSKTGFLKLRQQIEQILPDFYDKDAVIETLIGAGKLAVFDEKFYCPPCRGFLEFVKENFKEDDAYTIEKRAAGYTLEEIAKSGSKIVTRERIRQKEARVFRRLHTSGTLFQEDCYLSLYQTYHISEKDFIDAFQETKATYYYLSTIGHAGAGDLEDLIDDANYPDSFRKAAENIVYKNYVQIGNDKVPATKVAILEYILKTAGSDGLHFGELQMLYDMTTCDLGMKDDNRIGGGIGHTYENVLSSSRHALLSLGKRYRYYNIDEYDMDELLKELDFDQFKNVDAEYSAQKFFNSKPELMAAFDLRSGNELHNLLKKLDISSRYPFITMGRMPMMKFGNGNRDKQVMDLLLTLAPISKDKLAGVLHEEYGIDPGTATANWFKCIDKYERNGTFYVDQKAMPQALLEQFKEGLTEEIYLIPKLKEYFAKKFPQADLAYFNSYNLKQLGYIVYSDYMIKSEYSNAKEFFQTKIMEHDVFNYDDLFNEDIRRLWSVNSSLYDLEAKLEVIEYSPRKYITIHKLNEAGVAKDDLYSFCGHVARVIKDGEFFTVGSLLQSGFDDALFELGFDELFYSSLLATDKQHFSSQRLGDTYIFQRGSRQFSLTDLIEQTIYEHEGMKMDIYELQDLLKERYSFYVEKYKLIERCKSAGMHFDPISEKIYADYDLYFETV